MSTPFNNQWILDRTDPGRGTACAPAGRSEGPDALVPLVPPVPREVLRPHPRQRSRTVRKKSAGLHKRPKWIDRDT